jgi:flavin-dependent thymidylate synthase
MPLSVRLAGYNLDADLLKEVLNLLARFDDKSMPLRYDRMPQADLITLLDAVSEAVRNALSLDSFTPETISAAYARISRDPSHVSELRKAARHSVARSRKSNENIIFGLGHASVAEHACFNFDIFGLSRLASEDLQSHRLLSFTEKSQRYITIASNFVIPPELENSPWIGKIEKVVSSLFESYERLCSALTDKYMSESSADLSKTEAHDIEIHAKEDARYLLPLACATQMGMTINARNIEYVACDFSDHPLQEVRDLGKALSQAASALAPSLVKYTTRGAYPRENREQLQNLLEFDKLSGAFAFAHGPSVHLINSTPDGEIKILKALAFTSRCPESIDELSPDKQAQIWQELFRNMQPHDSAPRELEMAHLTYEAEISASCFAQLKRHRMMTLLQQPYASSDGAIIPPSITEAGFEPVFIEAISTATEAAIELRKEHPLLAPYLLTNAHKKRVLIHVTARELYHISRLRCDSHAQWEIRDLATQMLTQAKALWPNVFLLACGKDQFPETYNTIFSSDLSGGTKGG